ncbi:MAG: beta-galactosidase [Verrucomicrobia bacterium]|nr:beta-galactosidase [Verrucomicrobiota bacterium]
MVNSKEIFGAEIQYFEFDPTYWEKTIVHLKGTGLRCVSTYVPWSMHLVGPPDKKHPAGVLDFEGRTNPRLNLVKFLDLVEKHGLNLNFRAGPFCCNEFVHGGYPLAFLAGSPVIERAANRRLRQYVRNGGVLVLSGPWPARNEQGHRLAFLGLTRPGKAELVLKIELGQGHLIWHRAWLAQDKPEAENLESIEFVSTLVRAHVPKPHVRLRVSREVTWTDWQEGGGTKLYRQPRNLGSAILQRGPDELILFVLNHYPEAAGFEVDFPRDKVRELQNLATGEVIPVKAGRATLDLDRKSAEMFRVVIG